MQYKENGIFIIYWPKRQESVFLCGGPSRQRGRGNILWLPGQKGNVIKTTCLKTCLVSKFNNKSQRGKGDD